MQLLRLLFLSSARYNFKVMAKHVPGKTNSIADALSRFNMQAFFQLAPQARRTPVAKWMDANVVRPAIIQYIESWVY